MPAGIVRMNGVTGVGREAKRLRQRPMPLVERGTEAGGDACQHIGKHWPRGTGMGATAELFMIKSCDHRNDITLARVDQGDQTRMHAAEVVQPARGEKFSVRPEDRRCRGVVQAEIIAIDVTRRAASSLRYMINNLHSRMADTADRHRMGLLVQPKTFVVHTSIKMNGQLRNPHDRFGADEQCARIAQHEATGQTKLAIQPRVEQWGAVDLDTDLLPAIRSDIRPWLEGESSRIGV